MSLPSTVSTARLCFRCFTTSLRTRAAREPVPLQRDWENAPVATIQSFKHVQNQAIRSELERSSKVYNAMLGLDPATGRTLSEGTSSSPVASTSALPPSLPTTYEIPPLEDPLLGFLTNLMMRDGKKATARKHVSLLLSTLRLRSSSAPLPLVREAIRLSAPSVRITQQKRLGKQAAVPIALGERQRVHKAISWILEASDKRKNPNAGGSKKFGERVAIEVEAVLNGSSEVLKRKEQLHATATVNRANASTR